MSDTKCVEKYIDMKSGNEHDKASQSAKAVQTPHNAQSEYPHARQHLSYNHKIGRITKIITAANLHPANQTRRTTMSSGNASRRGVTPVFALHANAGLANTPCQSIDRGRRLNRFDFIWELGSP